MMFVNNTMFCNKRTYFVCRIDLLVENSYRFIGGIHRRKTFVGNDEKNGSVNMKYCLMKISYTSRLSTEKHFTIKSPCFPQNCHIVL